MVRVGFGGGGVGLWVGFGGWVVTRADRRGAGLVGVASECRFIGNAGYGLGFGKAAGCRLRFRRGVGRGPLRGGVRVVPARVLLLGHMVILEATGLPAGGGSTRSGDRCGKVAKWTARVR